MRSFADCASGDCRLATDAADKGGFEVEPTTGDFAAAHGDGIRNAHPRNAAQVGSAIMAVTAFQFYLQYAYGQLRLHVWFSLISAALSIPVAVYAVLEHGVYGAALAWFGLRMITFLIWPSVVHKRFAADLHRPWLQDLLRITAMTGLGLLLGEPVFNAIVSDNRFDILLGLAVSGLICLTLVTLTTRPLVMRLYVMMTKSSV